MRRLEFLWSRSFWLGLVLAGVCLLQARADLRVDANFRPSLESPVGAACVLKSGKILVSTHAALGKVVRLEASGAIDPAYPPVVLTPTHRFPYTSTVRFMLENADGSMLLAGDFREVNGVLRDGLVRLTAQGEVDQSFGTGDFFVENCPYGECRVEAMEVQTDGKVLLRMIGVNTIMPTHTAWRLFQARLDANGVGEPDFMPAGLSPLYPEQSDGKLVVWRRLLPHRMSGDPTVTMERYLVDGTLDTSFQPDLRQGLEQIFSPEAVALDGNDRILVSGVGGPQAMHWKAHRLFRLTAEGKLDHSFPGLGFDAYPTVVQPLSDGSILIGGAFTNGTNSVTGEKLPLNRYLSRLVLEEGPARITGITASGSFAQGADAKLEVMVSGASPFAYQWTFDGQPLAGATGRVLLLPDINPAQAGAYRARVTNAEGTVISDAVVVEVLAEPGGLVDQTFLPPAGLDQAVEAIAVLADGRLLVGGAFTNLSQPPRARIARLQGNGSLDPGFDPGMGPGSGSVRALLVQPDGNILAGGTFTNWNGTVQNGLVRLAAEGALDQSFAAAPLALPVKALLLRPDARIQVASTSTRTPSGFSSTGAFSLLEMDGRLDADASFIAYPFTHAQFFVMGSFNALARSPDGAVYVGGFSMRGSCLRLNPAGVLDPTFAPVMVRWLQSPSEANIAPTITAMVALADGGVLIAGNQAGAATDQSLRRHLYRLNPDGTINPNFQCDVDVNVPIDVTPVTCLAAQSDGKILIGGQFTTINGVPRRNLARLHSTGQLDLSFDPGTGPDGPVNVLVIQADGKILMGGDFTNINGIPRARLARLTSGPISPLPGIEARWTSASELTLTIGTRPGIIYQLQSRAQLGTGAWKTVTTFTGDGGPKVISENPNPAASQFYRVTIAP